MRATLVAAKLAALDRLIEEALGLAARAGERVGADVVDDGAEAGARGDDGDARAHRAAAGDADGAISAIARIAR